MKLTEFKTCIEALNKISDKIDAAYKLDIDLINFSDDYHVVISTLFKAIYGESGYDWISWWLEDKERKAWEKNGTPIDFSTVEKLWEYLEANCKGKSKTKKNKVKQKKQTKLLTELDCEKIYTIIKDKILIKNSYITYTSVNNITEAIIEFLMIDRQIKFNLTYDDLQDICAILEDNLCVKKSNISNDVILDDISVENAVTAINKFVKEYGYKEK